MTPLVTTPPVAAHEHLSEQIADDLERWPGVELARKLQGPPGSYRPVAYACDRPSASTDPR